MLHGPEALGVEDAVGVTLVGNSEAEAIADVLGGLAVPVGGLRVLLGDVG